MTSEVSQESEGKDSYTSHLHVMVAAPAPASAEHQQTDTQLSAHESWRLTSCQERGSRCPGPWRPA